MKRPKDSMWTPAGGLGIEGRVRGYEFMFLQFEALASYKSDERVKANVGAAPTKSKPERDARKKKEWMEFRGLVDLKLDKLCHQKEPAAQVAAVAAIITECLVLAC